MMGSDLQSSEFGPRQEAIAEGSAAIIVFIFSSITDYWSTNVPKFKRQF